MMALNQRRHGRMRHFLLEEGTGEWEVEEQGVSSPKIIHL